MEDNNVVETAVNESTETEVVKEEVVEQPKERTFTRSELNKIINAEREKVRSQVVQEMEAKRTEAERLAKMSVEEKNQYQINQLTKRNQELESQINANSLRVQANKYAQEKGLPTIYLDDLNFAQESAETVKAKIDKLAFIRAKDMEFALKSKLRQTPPQAVENKKEKVDPYLLGFENYYAKK